MITKLIEIVYSFLWGDLIQIPLPGGSSVGISLLIILLIPMGIYFTVRTRFLPIRLFPDMVRALVGTKAKKDADGKSEKKEIPGDGDKPQREYAEDGNQVHEGAGRGDILKKEAQKERFLHRFLQRRLHRMRFL